MNLKRIRCACGAWAAEPGVLCDRCRGLLACGRPGWTPPRVERIAPVLPWALERRLRRAQAALAERRPWWT